MRKSIQALIGFVFGMFLWGNSAHAAINIVTTNADDGSSGTLRQIILNSNPGDTINFDASLSGSTILLTNGQILLTNNMTIDASALPLGIQINGNKHSEVFEVTNSTVVLNSLTITNGVANTHLSYGYSGGGICNDNNGTLTLANCTVSGNSASGFGGGIYNNGMLTLNNCTLSGNSTSHGGGSIYNNSGIMALNQCTLSGNSAGGTINGGGGVYNGGTMTLTNCTLSGNSSTNDFGGGVYNIGTMTLTNCILSGNSSVGPGGGIYNDSSGTMTLNQCTLSRNIGVLSSLSGIIGGGGIYNSGGTLMLNECTLSGNSVGSSKFLGGGGFGGGGIFLNNGTLALNQCTLSGNAATNLNQGGGGGICINAGTVMITNSIVAGNTSGLGADIYNFSTKTNVTYAGSNIVNHLSGYYIGPAPITNAPLLAPLGNYGGSTQTMPPLIGSPALDAVTNSVTNLFATDQRGYPRLSGTLVDIGAVELQQATVTTLAASNLTLSNATLNATITANELTNSFYFAYGTTASYGSFSQTNTLPAGFNPVTTNAVITGLSPGTTYHYQALVYDGVNVKTGGDVTITTLVIAGNPSVLTGLTPFSTGAFGFSFTNVTGASFTVYASTNIAFPLAQWSNLGLAVESPAGSGQYQFTDPQATNNVQCFYRVTSP